MQSRALPPLPIGLKSQAMTVTYKGKTYAICSDGQMNYLKQVALTQVAMEAAEKGVQLNEAQMVEAVIRRVEDQGHATLRMVLAKMTPQEQRQWATKYRFDPIGAGRSN